jgi:hypothetical protein
MSDLNGPNQAQAMLRRVSPEGRARALREQQLRQKRTGLFMLRLLAVAVVVGGALAAYDAVFGVLPGYLLVIAAVVALAAVVFLGKGLADTPLAPAHLDAAPLASLPETTAHWLEAQAPALPAPAASLADTIAGELGAMGAQLARLSPDEPAALAVKRLLAVELPGLIERHQGVPPALRAHVRQAGQSADDHLVNGLAIIRDEVSRMSEQLARGDLDALATQDRFLELKYQGEAMLGPEIGA